MKKIFASVPRVPSWQISAIPLFALAFGFIAIILIKGPLAVSDYSPAALLSSAGLALVLSLWTGCLTYRGFKTGLYRSASQVLPAIPMLLCIAALATTWMLSGIVPTLVKYGLMFLNPQWFLVTACGVCALVSVITGSSWSTIATIGVAFLGIGSAMGYSPGWTAGAIISGAYFGDKVSPLSDTTVIAASTCNVDLFRHIKYMMITTVPAMAITLIVFGIKGFTADAVQISGSLDTISAINSVFNITPWVLIVPVITIAMIALQVPTLTVLASSAIIAGICIFIFQPQLHLDFFQVAQYVFSGYDSHTGLETVDTLLSTGGISGIISVVFLVLSALVLGWIMIGSGMLDSIASALRNRLSHRVSIVGATLGTGLVLNAVTADQYLSIILTGNVYRGIFRKKGMETRLLSRSLEDGVSVTSPLIPWSSCGVTQATVLGVSTLTYLPYCVFNYLTPLVSLFIISTGFKVRKYIVATS